MTYHIFIGYDEREHEVFQVAKHSLEKHATVPIKVHKLHQKTLRQQGLFTREYKVDSSGQYIDLTDGRPFSTQFTFTRFLVPELWGNISGEKSPLVMFVDCDFVFLEDIGDMFKAIEAQKIVQGPSTPIYCTHHNYKPLNEVKMDGMSQSNYNMKLWAAMMVFDMEHHDNYLLTPEVVNMASGRDLMNFYWIEHKERMGWIPEKWHHIPNHSEKNHKEPIGAIHFTEGGPWFPNYRLCRYADVWKKAYNEYLRDKIISTNFKIDDIIDGN